MSTDDRISIIAPILFAIRPDMTSSQATTEMYSKTVTSSHSSKLIMQAMIMITIAYENVCSAARAAAAAAGVAYAPHTLAEYEVMIDQPAHAAYVVAAALAVMTAPDPFVPPLHQTHVELLTTLDVFVAGKHWNQVFNLGGNAAQQLAQSAQQQAQQERVERSIAVIMKDCNFVLTNALCAALNGPDMQSFRHLTNLSFVQEAMAFETSFGRIPDQDLRLPHKQLFCRLVHEFFRVGRLRGITGDHQFPLLNALNIAGGLDVYKKLIDSYFVNLRNYRFATSETTIDYMQATARGAFLFKTSQDPATPDALKKEYVAAFQAYCTELNDNQAYITNARMDIIEAALRQRCAAAQIVMAFDTKMPFDKARLFQAPVPNLVPNLITETNALVAIGKVIEEINKRQSTTEALQKAVPVGKAVSRGGFGKKSDAIFLWCGKKGHLLFDCDGPAPNYAAQMAREELVAKRERDRHDVRKSRRLSSAASSTLMSDEEGDVDFSELDATYEQIQALFLQRDHTKP